MCSWCANQALAMSLAKGIEDSEGCTEVGTSSKECQLFLMGCTASIYVQGTMIRYFYLHVIFVCLFAGAKYGSGALSARFCRSSAFVVFSTVVASFCFIDKKHVPPQSSQRGACPRVPVSHPTRLQYLHAPFSFWGSFF